VVHRPTVAVYEARAADWEAKRTPRVIDRARAFAARVGAGPTADLGCGPGWYAAVLAPPVVAMDAAASMLARTGELAPAARRVRGDLERLPFRRGALQGGWAHNSYVHVARTAVPLALAELHRAVAVGGQVDLTFFEGDQEHGPVPHDDFAGRAFSLWSAGAAVDVVTGAGFTIDEFEEHRSKGGADYTVQATRARTLPDTVGPGMRLLVCGLNPSLRAADAGVGFATPTNRFWKAAMLAGLVTRPRDPWRALRDHGIGMTDLVKRASVGAAELTRAEYAEGLGRVERLVAWLQPGAVCFVGLAGWRGARDRRAVAGPQPERIGGRPAYVMPSTSGLAARVSPAELAHHLGSALALASE
jgi:TDG/mug DNA glycosylase family protein